MRNLLMISAIALLASVSNASVTCTQEVHLKKLQLPLPIWKTIAVFGRGQASGNNIYVAENNLSIQMLPYLAECMADPRINDFGVWCSKENGYCSGVSE